MRNGCCGHAKAHPSTHQTKANMTNFSPEPTYPAWYARASAPFHDNPDAPRILNALDKGLVGIIALAYIGTLAWLAFLAATAGDTRIWKALLVPAVSFVLVSAFRKAVNAPRPYEAFDIDPLIKKETHGKSFPSRHLFSAAIIAFALWWVNPVFGPIALIACVVVGFCRIVGGVHFPRDIVGAFIFAIIFALIGFILIP